MVPTGGVGVVVHRKRVLPGRPGCAGPAGYSPGS